MTEQIPGGWKPATPQKPIEEKSEKKKVPNTLQKLTTIIKNIFSPNRPVNELAKYIKACLSG
jgi:hypothetical protein